jgi:hypothetical protein
MYRFAARSVEEWRTERRIRDQEADRDRAAERDRLKAIKHLLAKDPNAPEADQDPEPADANGWGPRRKLQNNEKRERKYLYKMHGLSSRPDPVHMWACAQPDVLPYAAAVRHGWQGLRFPVRTMTQSEWDVAMNDLSGGFAAGGLEVQGVSTDRPYRTKDKSTYGEPSWHPTKLWKARRRERAEDAQRPSIFRSLKK